jgi:hypothetical protein
LEYGGLCVISFMDADGFLGFGACKSAKNSQIVQITFQIVIYSRVKSALSVSQVIQ